VDHNTVSTAPATDDLVAVTGLEKHYGQGDGLHGLDLTIARGSAFGFLGPNGAGKSTTIKILMGLLTPTAGTVNLFGQPLEGDAIELRQRIGYVPEEHFMYPWMTVDEIIWFTRSFYPEWDDDFCHRVREYYGLALGKKVRELSHGMRTKLALVLALSHNPELLILDEPTTGLDPLIREEFLAGVNQLRAEKGCTVLFSSHILSDVETMADTIGIIDRGRLLVSRRKEDLTAQTRRLRVSGNLRPDRPPPGTIRARESGQDQIYTVANYTEKVLTDFQSRHPDIHVTVERPGLEDIFKDYIRGARGE
jgi:ABC-2 type transport system ATP-binding protein